MINTSTLDNGLRITTIPMRHTRSVTLAIFVKAGSRYEADADAGVFHFIEHMLFKGTKRRPTARVISEAIEGVGGTMNASTDRELTTYWCKVARPHLLIAIDVLMDMLRNAVFDPDEIEKERGVVLEELAMTNDYPDEKVNVLLDKMLWGGQPIGRDVGGDASSVKSITRRVLLNYTKQGYRPESTVVVVAGDIDHLEIVNLLTGYLGKWTSKQKPILCLPASDQQSRPQVQLEYQKTDQTHICFGLRGLSWGHPQRRSIDLLSVILGEGMSSRLFLKLREDLGLVYSIYSENTHLSDTGAFIIYCSTQSPNVQRAISSIKDSLIELRNGIPDEEMRKAKETIKGRLLLSMEDTRNMAMWYGVQASMGGQSLTVDEVIDCIDAVTGEDLQQVAEHLVFPEHMNVAVVGPLRGVRRLENLFN